MNIQLKNGVLYTVIGDKESNMRTLIRSWIGEDAVELFDEIMAEKEPPEVVVGDNYEGDAEFYCSQLHDTLNSLDEVIATVLADRKATTLEKLKRMRSEIYEIL